MFCITVSLFFSFSFHLFSTLKERVLNCLNPELPQRKKKTELHHSCILWGGLNVRAAIWRARFPWQQVTGLGWRAHHAREIVRGPWFSEPFELKVKEQMMEWKQRHVEWLKGSRQQRRKLHKLSWRLLSPTKCKKYMHIFYYCKPLFKTIWE